MSDPFDGSDDLDELTAGRGDIDKTEVPDWIILSGCSARALQLYQLLRLRLNRRRRDKRVWPGLATLAVMMKLTTSESVSPYVSELKKLGAIDVQRTGHMPRRNIYVIHFAPADDYDGPLCIEDWDADPEHKLAARRIRTIEKQKRDKMRAAQTAKAQVRPEPGKNPVQGSAGKTVSPDPGKIRDQDPGKIPVLDPGKIRVEPLGVTEGSSVPGRRSSAPSGDEQVSEPLDPEEPTDRRTSEQQTDFSSEIENQQFGYAADGYPLDVTSSEAALIAEIDRARPDWGPRHIRIAVGHPSVRARAATSPGLVRRAFLLAAADKPRPKQGYKGTYSLNRLTVDGCPIWSRALADMDAEASAEIDRGQPEFCPEVSTTRTAEASAQPAVPASRPHEEYLEARARLAASKESASA
jgi:hypothetical protein